MALVILKLKSLMTYIYPTAWNKIYKSDICKEVCFKKGVWFEDVEFIYRLLPHVKSIGVGQYQHDMPQKRLTEVLDGVVEDCVNAVGADVNTASPSLLKRVAGLNEGIAKNIVTGKIKKPSNNDFINGEYLKQIYFKEGGKRKITLTKYDSEKKKPLYFVLFLQDTKLFDIIRQSVRERGRSTKLLTNRRRCCKISTYVFEGGTPR